MVFPRLPVALLCVVLLAGLDSSQAQTLSIRLVEQAGQPLSIEIDGSITELGAGAISTSEDGLENDVLDVVSNGFYLINSSYRGHQLAETYVNLSGCRGFTDGAIDLPRGTDDIPSIGFTAGDITATSVMGSAAAATKIFLPADYILGSDLERSIELPSYTSLSELGWRTGDMCAVEWSGENTTQRLEIVAVGPRGPTQTARIELFEDGIGNVRIVSSGHLSDTRGLGRPIAVDPLEEDYSSIVFGSGFYISHPGHDSEVYAVPQATYRFNKACNSLSSGFRWHELAKGTNLPTFGFDTAFASVIVNLPTNYTAGASLAGTGMLENSSLAALQLRPGARCHVEWLPTHDAPIRQRLAVNVADNIFTTVYLVFPNSISGLGEMIDHEVVDTTCSAFAQRVLQDRVYHVQCSTAQGAAFPGHVELQVLVTGSSAGQVGEDLLESLMGTYDMQFFLGGEARDSPEETMQVLDAPSVSFSLFREWNEDLTPITEVISAALDRRDDDGTE